MGHPNKPLLQHKFLDAVVGTNDGIWYDVSGWAGANIHISGINGDTVQVFGSNKPTVPANNAAGCQLGSDITIDNSYLYFSGPWLWMKVKVSSAGSGTISAWAVGNPY